MAQSGETARPASTPPRPSATTSTYPGVRRRRVYTLTALAIAVVALIAALSDSGAAGPPALLDPGALVRWGLPVLTVGVHAAATLTVGAFACCATVLTPGESGDTGGAGRTSWARAAQAGTIAAIAWTLLQAVHLVFTNAAMLGEPLATASNPWFLVEFITGTETGGMLAWSVMLSALVALVAVVSTTASGAAWAFVAGVVALIPVAATGHAASGAGHTLAVSAMWLHLVGMAIWIGGLVMLMLTGTGARERRAVGRYSEIAGWGFAIVFASGLANAVVRLNAPGELLTTAWGRLLLVKVVAFAALGAAGYAHRCYILAGWPREGPGGYARALFWRLAGVELLIMGAIVGVSVALGSTTAPVPEQQSATVFIELTGHPAPPALTVETLLTQWRWEPVTALLAIAGALTYTRWVLRLYRRGHDWPLRRTISWLCGMALFLWTTNGGLAVYASAQFSAHMAQHMLLVMFLPILYVIAAPATLAFRALPVRDDGTNGPREYLLALLHSRPARFLSHPVVAALNVVVSMGVFYLTGLFEFTLGSHVAHLAMVLHFSLAGHIFVNILIGRDPGPRRPFYPLRLVLLLPSMVFHTFFGLGLVSSTTLLAAPYYARLQPHWVTDPLIDQQIGGAMAWATGELPVLGLAVVIALAWVRADDARTARERRRARRAAPDVAA